MGDAEVRYQAGFGSDAESEAEPGALPPGQNSPQSLNFGLVSELVSGTTFSAPRALNRRSYLFRIRPSVVHGAFKQIALRNFVSAPFSRPPDPNQMRWRPRAIPLEPTDMLEGIFTICGNGDVNGQRGVAIHAYTCNRSMCDLVFSDADGELLFVPLTGDN